MKSHIPTTYKKYDSFVAEIEDSEGVVHKVLVEYAYQKFEDEGTYIEIVRVCHPPVQGVHSAILAEIVEELLKEEIKSFIGSCDVQFNLD